MTSFADFAFRQLERHGDKVFIIDGGSGRKLTFAQVLKESQNLTRWLRGQVSPTQVVCLCARSRAEYIPAFLAVAASGAIACQVNPEFTYGEMRQTFDRVSPVLIFCDPDNLQIVREAADSHQTIVVFSDHVDPSVSGAVSYGTVLCEGSRGHQDCQPLTLPEGSALHLLFSSGTTGLPKPVLVGHSARITNAYQLADPSVLLFEPDDVVLLILPLYLMFATILWSVALLQGSTVVLLPRFRPETFLDAIQGHRVSTLPTAPPLVLFLLECPLVDKFDLSSLKSVVCGGAPLPPSLGEDIKKKFNLKSVRQGYGMTEAGHLTLPPPPDWCGQPLKERPEWESIGRTLPDTEFQVRDLSTGRPLGPLQTGELSFRGPQTMLGYLDNPQATSGMVDSHGWLHTGDVGYFDEEGFIYFVDRAKDLIKSKGHQVAPLELESILVLHPSVSDAAVLGLPDLYAGELPAAFVVLKSGLKEIPRPEEIGNFVAERTCRQKHLTGGVRFVESIPRTPSGKILRRKLREMLLGDAQVLQHQA